jgi:hypothetical protein
LISAAEILKNIRTNEKPEIVSKIICNSIYQGKIDNIFDE